MGLDARFKAAFPVVLAFGIGIAAYLQALALSRLISAAVTARSAVVSSPRRPAPGTAAQGAQAGPPKVADEILQRNPFDSVTGPLDGRVLDHPAFGGENGDPVCPDARVVLIAASNRGHWSFAAIVGADGMPMMRREGDAVAGRTVVGIGWDRVLLAREGARCELRLGAPPPSAPAHASTSSRTSPAERGPSTRERDLVARVRPSKDGSVHLDRAVAAEIMERYPELVRSIRLAPEKDGVRLFGIRPGSMLAALGLQNGDRLDELNGVDVRDPRKMIEAYARLSDMRHLSLKVRRAGQSRTIDIHID
jgi:general secretion pathway protein C